MKINTFKTFLKEVALKNIRVPILLQGPMGAGKSQAVHQVANELGFTYVDLRPATQDEGDLIGMPEKDVQNRVTRYLRPEWVPEKDVKLMLVLEELNRAQTGIMQALMQVLTEYRIHMYELPTITTIVACINPPNDIYNVAELDPAMTTRCINLKLEPDVEEFMRYAKQMKFEDSVIQFNSVHKDQHLCKPVATGPCPLPRTWEIVSKITPLLNSVPDSQSELLSGIIGSETAVVYQKFIRDNYKRPVTAEEILNSYDKVKEKLWKQRNDEMSSTSSMLKISLEEICSKSKIKAPQIKNLETFILDCPTEWTMVILNNIPQASLKFIASNEVVTKLTEIFDAINKAEKDQASKQKAK